jgi:AP2-associated kinase
VWGVWGRRDLKAENVLLHASGTWVLCDYGSTTAWAGRHEGSDAILLAEEDIRRHTTPAYRPPEARMHGLRVYEKF